MNTPKSIIIFNVTGMNTEFLPQTNLLINKMNAYAKKEGIEVRIQMDSASKIDTKAKEFDVILLGPELYAIKEEIKEKFPQKVIHVIDQKDYGFLDGEAVLKLALS